jgi:hypothetical protein
MLQGGLLRAAALEVMVPQRLSMWDVQAASPVAGQHFTQGPQNTGRWPVLSSSRRDAALPCATMQSAPGKGISSPQTLLGDTNTLGRSCDPCTGRAWQPADTVSSAESSRQASVRCPTSEAAHGNGVICM